jgi:hypothetical protein
VGDRVGWPLIRACGGNVRTALRRDLAAAMKAQDVVSVSALRSALAAIENAEAVDVATDPPKTTPHWCFARSVAGLGNGQVPLRVTGDLEVERLVRPEVEERQEAARALEEVPVP